MSCVDMKNSVLLKHTKTATKTANQGFKSKSIPLAWNMFLGTVLCTDYRRDNRLEAVLDERNRPILRKT